MSSVEVKDIWAEDLFMWFFAHVNSAGGDGSAAIVVKNYQEVAEYFQEWFHGHHGRNMSHLMDISSINRWVNFHDSNENFIFTDDENVKLHRGDYVFIVREDCVFSGSMNPKTLYHV